MGNLDLRLLKYFVTVAELEHIGKAAASLHISQSPLSRQIRQLESDLDLQLFVRERQRIYLTESGKWLLVQAQKLLAHADKIRAEATQRAAGKTGTLSVGFVSSAISSGVLPKLLRRFQTEFPDATLELRNMRSSAQMDAVESGRIDVGFVRLPTSSSVLESTCVSEEAFMLVVPGKHPLARKRSVVSRDLQRARWILLSHAVSADRRARFVAGCGEAGFTPQIVQEVTEPNTLLGLVDSGFGIGVMEGSARHCAPRSLKFLPLPWFPFKSRIYLIRPSNGRQPLADTFAGYALGAAA